MKLIAGPRGSGKTTRLLEWAKEDPQNRLLIFADDRQQQMAQVRARQEMGFKLLASSFTNHWNNRHRYFSPVEIGFDDGCIEQALGVPGRRSPAALVVTTEEPEPADLEELVQLEKDLR